MKEALVFAAGFAVLAAAGAEAQQGPRHCGHRDAIVKRLAEGYGESRRSMGMAANNSVMEIFVSDVTGTWTITVTMPNGTMCLVATGRGFESLPGMGGSRGPAGLPT